jgi:hypothetical protein
MFQVQRKPCESCIYRQDSPLDLAQLEAAIADPHMPGFFTGYRTCHHTTDDSGICCAGFWAKHRMDFTLGQIAQRMGWVEYVDVDIFRKDDNATSDQSAQSAPSEP